MAIKVQVDFVISN